MTFISLLSRLVRRSQLREFADPTTFYDGFQRVTWWPTMSESSTSVPGVMRLRITDEQILIESKSQKWKFEPTTATAAECTEGVVLVTDDVSWLFHPKAGDEPVLERLWKAGAAQALA